MKYIRYFLGIDERYVVYSINGTWVINGEFGEYNESCYYEIWFHPEIKRVRIKCGGYRPKHHNLYRHVVAVQLNILKRFETDCKTKNNIHDERNT